MLNLAKVTTMRIPSNRHQLTELAQKLKAELAIFSDSNGLIASAALQTKEQTRWEAYSHIHAHCARSARFHLFSPMQDPKFILIERTAEGGLLFLVYPASISIANLEDNHAALTETLNQADPNPLTQVVLDLDPSDLKRKDHPQLGETQPVQVDL